MKKTRASVSKCVELVQLIRPDLTPVQAVAAGKVLLDEVHAYLRPGNEYPSIRYMIYQAGLTDEEFDTFYNLSYEEQRKLVYAV